MKILKERRALSLETRARGKLLKALPTAVLMYVITNTQQETIRTSSLEKLLRRPRRKEDGDIVVDMLVPGVPSNIRTVELKVRETRVDCTARRDDNYEKRPYSFIRSW